MSVNPYQSPATISPAPGDSHSSPAVWVEGNSLVVRSGTVLPWVCVRTNRPVSEEDLQEKTFDWCSPWVALLIFVSLLVVIIVYFIVRKKCRLTFGLDPEVRWKYRRRLLLKSLAAFLLLLAIPATAVVSDVVPFVVLVLFIVALIAVFVGNCPLRVVRHRKGLFWVKGFSDEYLANFPTEVAAY